MNVDILKTLNEVIDELNVKINSSQEDPSYEFILPQVIFVRDCVENGKNVLEEKSDRALNFPVVTSRNLTDPEDESLVKKIGVITNYLSSL
jgi:hypothetical protein|tara:strand:- start:3046 stop:3318 length:273 start_codon:yes stop_codon:yes gene_type:complete